MDAAAGPAGKRLTNKLTGAVGVRVELAVRPSEPTQEMKMSNQCEAMMQGQIEGALIEHERLLSLVDRLRFALGDGERKMNDSQLVRRAHELSQKARKWDEWHEAQVRIEDEMPEGWAFVIQCSPGDWDAYLTNPDGERIAYDNDCETLAQQMNGAVDEARAATTGA